MRLRRRENSVLQLPSFGTAEAGAQYDDCLGAPARQLVDQFPHDSSRGRDDRQIRRDRQLSDAGIAGQSRDSLIFRIDEGNIALEAAGAQIAEHHFADGSLAVAGADQGHRRRFEEMVKIANRHLPGPPDRQGAE
jgi:hypothetical protein